MAPKTPELVAQILNSAWLVRHYARGTRTSLVRQQAIQRLGMTVQYAFSISQDYETLLAAVVDGLRPEDRPPF